MFLGVLVDPVVHAFWGDWISSRFGTHPLLGHGSGTNVSSDWIISQLKETLSGSTISDTLSSGARDCGLTSRDWAFWMNESNSNVNVSSVSNTLVSALDNSTSISGSNWIANLGDFDGLSSSEEALTPVSATFDKDNSGAVEKPEMPLFQPN